MHPRFRIVSVLSALVVLAAACGSAAAPANGGAAGASRGPTRVVVGVTETIENQNPYGDSVALQYGIWCEVLGCLVNYDLKKGEYAPALAESWKVESPTTWTFNLNQKVRWQDGTPLTAADVVQSFERIAKDPDSRQKQNTAPVAGMEAVDDHTVKVTTKEPTASLLSFFADLFIVSQKAQYDKFGPTWFKQGPIGTGPYKFKELVANDHMTIVKNTNWWAGKVDGPDEVVYRILREPEVRVTALLNGEIQIAQTMPPQMGERVSSSPNARVATTDSLEIMFLAMSPKYKPWDNKPLRQAVAYAIDRDSIIKNVLLGQATRLDGPIGAGQYGYNPDLQPKYTYDPQKAKQLVAEAGYPNGLDVELSTPVGRYILDKQITQAMTPMLTAVGIRTKLVTPEWATLWANVQDGKVPFYYMGRGSVVDPGLPLAQYFETGGSPRIGYSNSKLDGLFKKERGSFDPNERKKVLSDVMSTITDEAPGAFMWRHKFLWGISNSIDYTPRADDRIFANDMRVK